MSLVSPQLVLVEVFIFRDSSIKPQFLCLLSLQNTLNENVLH